MLKYSALRDPVGQRWSLGQFHDESFGAIA